MQLPQVNFINAISGFSEKTNAPYYIVYGTSIGDHLGKALMDAFTNFLHQYVPSLRVYFVGSNPDNREDFSEADGWISRLKSPSRCGLHDACPRNQKPFGLVQRRH